MSYVVYICEHLRDGVEEGAKVKDTLEECLELVNHIRNSAFAGCNYSFRVFELGREVPIEEKTVEEPQPSKTKVRFVLKSPIVRTDEPKSVPPSLPDRNKR